MAWLGLSRKSTPLRSGHFQPDGCTTGKCRIESIARPSVHGVKLALRSPRTCFRTRLSSCTTYPRRSFWESSVRFPHDPMLAIRHLE